MDEGQTNSFRRKKWMKDRRKKWMKDRRKKWMKDRRKKWMKMKDRRKKWMKMKDRRKKWMKEDKMDEGQTKEMDEGQTKEMDEGQEKPKPPSCREVCTAATTARASTCKAKQSQPNESEGLPGFASRCSEMQRSLLFFILGVHVGSGL
ncbi:hypothetical protein CAPTEDRAFT_201916 [Capitella teleta]|uniref:Uncharacterized protein n=1 Tax=Capitella teleta TaxID=283909 RepID=R7TCB7_CAPTE|nr:hypothetical protein CAPTEDRAFT_201916 [Capitella teleta]|eukprot:ELT91339.1 hypothetical protein CAPTEDRAFT_201916 [Capitella teleta]